MFDVSVKPWRTLRRTNFGSFFLDPEDVRSISLGAMWNFSRGTGLP